MKSLNIKIKTITKEEFKTLESEDGACQNPFYLGNIENLSV